MSVGAMDEGDGGVRQLSVHRAEMLEVLYQALKEKYAGRVMLETDMKATSVEVSLSRSFAHKTCKLMPQFRTTSTKSQSTSPTHHVQLRRQTSS